MSWLEGEILSLIELVKHELFLYDVSRPDHYDRSKVYSTWNKIGRKLSKKGFQVRRMWLHLTKIYAWLVQNKECNIEEEGTWPYLEVMSFLKPFVEDYIVCDKSDEDLIDLEATIEAGVPIPVFITPSMATSRGGNSVSEQLEQHDQDNPENILPENSSSPVHQLQFPHSVNGLTQKKSLEIEDALCQYLKKKITKKKDPNEFFLTSVAHDMKMLSISDQVVFKMKVQQLLVEMISKSKG